MISVADARHVISALVPIRASAATHSARRHSTGIGAAIIFARMMPRSERMLSQVLGNCRATTESAGNPVSRSRAAMADTI